MIPDTSTIKKTADSVLAVVRQDNTWKHRDKRSRQEILNDQIGHTIGPERCKSEIQLEVNTVAWLSQNIVTKWVIMMTRLFEKVLLQFSYVSGFSFASRLHLFYGSFTGSKEMSSSRG